MLQAASLGYTAAEKQAKEELGPGANAVANGKTTSLTIIWLQSSGLADSSSEPELSEILASQGVTPLTSAIHVVAPESGPALEQVEEAAEVADTAQSVGDPETQSKLFGRYTGQIVARIDRAWRRPRSPVHEPGVSEASASTRSGSGNTFRCKAKILQDNTGRVREIELLRCNGSVAWQQSLVSAIQQSSPFPAPPDPTVFSNVFTLSFESVAFAAGAPEGKYEPEAMLRVAVRDTSEPAAQNTNSRMTDGQYLPFNAPVPPTPEPDFASNGQMD